MSNCNENTSVDSKGLCVLCKEKVLNNQPSVRNLENKYTHKKCSDDSHRLRCMNCKQMWLWPKQSNFNFHPDEWTMSIDADGSTNESVYC